MIKTIIIDDNKIIREHFQTVIDWNAKGFELVAVAGNGITGLQEFERYRPQLVITDVKMPGMNGLELAKRVKEIDPGVMVVFISNYEDFDYLKTAMDIGAYDYILKHETRGKLFDQKLEKIKKEISSFNDDRRYYRESVLFSALVSNDRQKLDHAFPDSCSLLLLEQTGIPAVFSELTGTELPEPDRDEVLKLIYDGCDSVISTVKAQKLRYAVLTVPDSDMDSIANELCLLLSERTKTRFYALIVAENASIQECCDSYFRYGDRLNLKYFEPYHSLISPDRLIGTDRPEIRIDSAGLSRLLDEGNINTVCNMLDGYAQKIVEACDYDALCRLSACVLGYFADNGHFGETNDWLFNEDEIKLCTNAREILFWLKLKAVKLIKTCSSNPISSYSEPVRRAVTYMQKNYSRSELTVVEIAEAVGIDIYQLNKKMKSETGMTTIKWLTNMRIEKAKELLARQERISDVRKKTGYLNTSYFSYVFKKQCGESPIDYRRRMYDENSKNKKDQD